MPNRRAYWFFIEIWPQEVYYIAGILILAAVALFFVTSILGRVWCGYLCPQTVWTDLYMAVERLIQGDRNARIRLDQAPWSFEKIYKKGLTHLAWIMIALSTAGAYVFYFNDAPTLWRDILHCQVSHTVLIFMAGLTFSTYLMAGFAREQVCTYMCPYARFQSAMFDEDTLIIGYDRKRGEPRGHHKKGESWDGRGHCIDCTACVQVCPTGIDIRNGLQNECIACGLCVDACDDVMTKLGLPVGLIRYDTARRLEADPVPGQGKLRLIRPRTVYYASIIALAGSLMLYTLLTRAPQELHVLHDRNPLFVTLTGGEVRNGYEVKILNKLHKARHYSLHVTGLQGAALTATGAGDVSADDLSIPADAVGHYHVFVKAPPQANARNEIVFILKDVESKISARRGSVFISREEVQ
jgi:cytochrome c oxidase accessory protein FixG